MPRIRILLLAALLPALAGCPAQQDRARFGGTQRPAASERVDQLTLMVSPSPVSLDERPGADGARGVLYVVRDGEPVEGRGTFEFLLFEGNVPPASIASTEPFHVWHYSAGEMAGRFGRTPPYGLWGYMVTLAWPQAPEADSVTLVARYTPPGGRAIYSAPTAISMGTR